MNYIILATPPGFRPMHLKAAIEAGKHIFTEKPVAVDGPGIRDVLSLVDVAAQKKLARRRGPQRHHQHGYLETMKRIHDGAIGDIVAGRAYWNQGASGTASASRSGPTSSGRCATGSTSPGSAAITSSNSTSTTST